MPFGLIKIHAGNFTKGNGSSFQRGQFIMKTPGRFTPERLAIGEVAAFEVASEENVKRFAGAFGMGLVGGAALGGLGLLAGVLAGGTGKEVTVVCVFRDGRKFLGTMPNNVYLEIQAARFDLANGIKARQPMAGWKKFLLWLIAPFILWFCVLVGAAGTQHHPSAPATQDQQHGEQE